MAVYYLLTILAAFLQTVSRGVFWPLLVVGWAAGRKAAPEAYPLAFVGGMAVDLLVGWPLGVSAFGLLLLVFGISLFRSRFQLRIRWLIGFLVLLEVLYHFVLY